MTPAPNAAFVLGLRLAALGLAALAWQAGGIWIVTAGLWSVLTLGRVPSTRLGVELALVGAALAVLVGPLRPLAAAAAGFALLLRFVAPERGLLRLNGMDRYFVAQDYPGMPANSHICVELERPLDRAALDRAVAAIQRDVPLLRSFVREAAFGAERFEARRPFGGARLTWTDAAPEADGGALLHRRFDLEREPPLRVIHAARPGGAAVLVLTLHHSACDGEGLFLALGWLTQRYNEALAQRPAAPLALTTEGLRFRDAVRRQGKGLGWLVRMVRRHVRPLGKVGVLNASLYDDVAPTACHTRHLLGRIDPHVFERLGQQAGAGELTRNDLLVACALRAADQHQQARGRADRPFRLLLPTNLRGTLKLGPGLQNFLGVVRADFGIDEVRTPGLPDIVHARVREGRSLEDAVETPVNIGVMCLLLPPWLMRRALRKLDLDTSSSFFSFLFSNMRSPPLPALDGVRTESVAIRGSLGRRPPLGLALAREQAGMAVTIEYSYPLVTDASAAGYLERFLGEVAAVGGAGRPVQALLPPG